MLTFEELEAKLKDVNDKVATSLNQITQVRQNLEQMNANHNALLGAQMMATEMLNDAKKNDEETNKEL